MSSLPHDAEARAHSSRLLDKVEAWLVRRRVVITLVCLTALATYNLGIKATVPLNPFDVTSPWSVTAWCVLLLGLAIRSWAAGMLHKNTEITQVGPYAFCRNPLYLGSYLMIIGLCIFTRDRYSTLFAAGPLLVVYRFQILHEERMLRALFGEQWDRYAATVPRILPRRLPVSRMFAGWEISTWTKNREYRACIGTLCGIVAIYFWHVTHVGH